VFRLLLDLLKRKKIMTSSIVDYGGETDKYKWHQTKDEVTVNIELGDSNIRAKDITCKFTPTSLYFGIVGQPPIIDGTFPDDRRISVGQSMWTKDESQVELTMTKFNKGGAADGGRGSSAAKGEKEDWWSCLVTKDAEKEGGSIDVEMIEARKYLDDSLLRKVKESKAQKKLEEQQGKVSEGGSSV